MKFLVKTLQGLEEVLRDELVALGGENVTLKKRGVACEGNLEFMYRANLSLRTALRVLVPVVEFRARNEKQLYDEVRKVDWSLYMDVSQTFAIDNTVFSEYFRHSKFAALKMKDAMVDQFRDKLNKRPSVDAENPDLLFNIHGFKDQFTISLDSSGTPLNQRQYRQEGHMAPLNEVLAAGLLKLAGWDKSIPLVDPMCGSGTILTEAGLMAYNIPPQLNRSAFAFRNWSNFQPMMWNRIKSEEQSKVRATPVSITGGDIDPNAIKQAKSAFGKCRFGRDIIVKQADFKTQSTMHDQGMIITNPPYGERIGHNVEQLYDDLGNHLRKNFQGFDVWILSSNKAALKQLHLKPEKTIELHNGAIKCEFCHYHIH